jgi:hypothetical protein
VLNSETVIKTVLKVASYTYGPLLGLFAFGLFSKLRVRDRWVPLFCCVAPLICFVVEKNSEYWFKGYKLGFELLILNGFLTAAGLWTIRRPAVA